MQANAGRQPGSLEAGCQSRRRKFELRRGRMPTRDEDQGVGIGWHRLQVRRQHLADEAGRRTQRGAYVFGSPNSKRPETSE